MPFNKRLQDETVGLAKLQTSREGKPRDSKPGNNQPKLTKQQPVGKRLVVDSAETV